MSNADEPSGAPESEARDRIDAEHRMLAGLLETMEQAADCETLLPVAEKLQTVLEQHFASEEAEDGLHSAVRDIAPHHIPHVDAVLNEHTRLRDLVAELVDTARRDIWPEAQQRAAELATELREHEGRENDLFIDSVMTDIGRGA